MTLNLTRRCNLSCRFCIVGDVLNTRTWRDYEATLEDVERLLAHPIPRRCLYVMLTGGEPLLNRDVAPIVRLLKSRRHLVGINTNGFGLTEVLSELASAGVDLLNVSHYEENAADLDGSVPVASRRIFTKLQKVIGADDLEDPWRIVDVMRLARDSGCRRVFFQNVYPHVDGQARARELPVRREPTGREKPPIADAHRLRFAALQAEMRRRFPEVSAWWPTPLPDQVDRQAKACRMPWYLFGVDAKGNTALCSGHASCTGPNLFEERPDPVPNAERWVRCRKLLLEDSSRVPADCEGCYGISDRWRRDV